MRRILLTLAVPLVFATPLALQIATATTAAAQAAGQPSVWDQPAPQQTPSSVWGDPPAAQQRPAQQSSQPSAFDRPAQQQAAPAGPSPFDQPPSRCVNDFMKLRTDAENKGKAIAAAAQRKATAQEVCPLFNTFAASEEKMVKFMVANASTCGIPPEALKQVQESQKKTRATRTQVCQVAAQPRRTGPTLGDALGTLPPPSASNIKTGRGTFDTLTGPAVR